MKRIFLLSCALLTLVLLTGVNSQEMTPFTASDGSFSLTYPENWTFEEGSSGELGGTGFSIVSDPSHQTDDTSMDEPFMVIQGQVFTSPILGLAEVMLEIWSEETLPEERFDEVREPIIIEEENKKLIAQSFVIYDFETSLKAWGDMEITRVYMMTENRAGVFVSTVNEAGLETFSPLFEAIVGSVDLSNDLALSSSEVLDAKSAFPVGSGTSETGASLSLSHPSTWITDEQFRLAPTEDMLSFGFTEAANVIIKITALESASETVTPDHFELVRQQLTFGQPFGTPSALQLGELEGEKAYYYSYSGDHNTSTVDIVMTFSDGKIYGAIGASFNLSGYLLYGQTVEAILESLRFQTSTPN